MDFLAQVKALAERIPSQIEHLKTEEATKNALVMPFINLLGYNVFDPTEVVPEFTADVGTKKGEKVDYAIMQEGTPIVLFECKTAACNLNQVHASQLFRYFSVTDAKFGILTNGIVYRFFTDLEQQNKMDEKPFLEINLLELDEQAGEELKRFVKSRFDIEATINAATDLKYTKEIKRVFDEELSSPSDDFVRHFASQVYSGKLVANVREQFRAITKRAIRQYINEQINNRLKSAYVSDDTDGPTSPSYEADADASTAGDDAAATTADDGVETTEEETEAYHIVKALLREKVDPSRIGMRDAKTYCSVLLDDNNRKPICRFWFNSKTKYIGVFDADKSENRIAIEKLDDIYRHSEALLAKLDHYGVTEEEATQGDS